MYSYSTRFFGEKRANSFAETLRKQGKKPTVWSERDFKNKCTIYFVKWN